MPRISKAIALTFLLAIWFSCQKPSACAAVQPMKTIVLSEGSVPPVFTQSFACIHELDNKPLSSPLIQDCVAKLKANYFVKDVKVRTKEMDEGRWVSVEFVLSSEPLKVAGFTIQTFDGQESEIWKMLSRSDANLHVGGIYTWSAESAAYFAITFLYRAQGKLVGVIPDLKMDYKQGEAWVNFRVVEGPRTLKHPLSPPYGTWCDDRIMYVDWTGSNDDGIPFELIESGLALASPFTCFSNELAQRDKDYLSNLSFLSESSVEYSGTFGNRTIRYKLKVKPLKVEKINLRGYGNAPTNLEDGDPSLLKNLNLRTGELFSRRAVAESVEFLRNSFIKNGYWAQVETQEESSGAGALQVTFSVLVFPLQRVVVDGRELQSTKIQANDASKIQ